MSQEGARQKVEVVSLEEVQLDLSSDSAQRLPVMFSKDRLAVMELVAAAAADIGWIDS